MALYEDSQYTAAFPSDKGITKVSMGMKCWCDDTDGTTEVLEERSCPVLLCPSQLAKNWATTRAGPSR